MCFQRWTARTQERERERERERVSVCRIGREGGRLSERKKLEIQRDSERFRGAETLTQGDRESPLSWPKDCCAPRTSYAKGNDAAIPHSPTHPLTRSHTHTHSLAHTHIHTFTHKTRTRRHTHAAHTHARKHARMHARTQARTHARTLLHIKIRYGHQRRTCDSSSLRSPKTTPCSVIPFW